MLHYSRIFSKKNFYNQYVVGTIDFVYNTNIYIQFIYNYCLIENLIVVYKA